MSYAEEYRAKLVTPEAAVRAVQSGNWVEYGQFAAQAVALDKALAARREELRDVRIRATTRILGIPEVVRADPTAAHRLSCPRAAFATRKRSRALRSCVVRNPRPTRRNLDFFRNLMEAA